MSIRLPALNLLQQPGEWAVNSPLGAVFPGDENYEGELQRAKTGSTPVPPKPTAPAGTAAKEETMSEWWNRVTGKVNKETILNATVPGYSALSNLSGYVAIILGLICIAAGLMMFKPVRDVVVSGAKVAATAA